MKCEFAGTGVIEINNPMKVTSETLIGNSFFWKERRVFFIIAILLLVNVSVVAQEKQVVQIKTFDQKLQVLKNIEVSINGKEYVSVGSKGVAIVELNSNDLPIKSIRIKDDKLEAASWNFSKGIVEIIVRPKSYTLVHFVVRFPNGNPLSQSPVVYKGAKTITFTTNQMGEFDLPVSLNEKIISTDQFYIQDMVVIKLNLSDQENVILVDRPKPIENPQKKIDEGISMKEDFDAFDVSRLDSIESLTEFYALFRSISIRNLNEETKALIDKKFNQLMAQREDSVSIRKANGIGNISDSSFVSEDVKSLLNYATLESEALQANRSDFESKVNVISSKLEKGISNLTEAERQNLLNDLDLLEQLLSQNERKFYQNQDDYLSIINTLKQKYFDIQNLETRLSKAEKEREEEQRVFRQRMIIIGGVLIGFAVLIILLISFSTRLRNQAKELKAANEEVSTINENLEQIVIRRTKLLEESNKELDTFLYRASHDLRSPIRSILGLCNITDHIPQAELVNRVMNTTYSMDRMLSRLIDVSEIGQESLNLTTVKVAQIINRIKIEQEKLIKTGGVQIHFDCPADITLRTSSTLLESILINLIENAIFFSVLKNPEHARVEVKVNKVGNDLELSVYDNGIGIEESIRPRIFDMFFTGHEMSKGNGLGLYMVHKCIVALRGKITVESEVGRYTTFKVLIPND